MNRLPYVLEVFRSGPEQEFVAVYREIPGLSGVGATESEAIDELKLATNAWLEYLRENNLPPPAAAGSENLAQVVQLRMLAGAEFWIVSASGVSAPSNSTSGSTAADAETKLFMPLMELEA